MIKITWQRLKKFKVVRALLTIKILKGFTIRIGLPQTWALKIAIWIWLRKKNISASRHQEEEEEDD